MGDALPLAKRLEPSVRAVVSLTMEVAMANTKEPKNLPKTPRTVPKRPGTDPSNKPARDAREDPAPNPEAGGDLPETNTRAEVEKVRPNVRR